MIKNKKKLIVVSPGRVYCNTKFHRNMFIQEPVVYCAFCLNSLDEIVPLTIIKAGRALKFFPFIIIYLYFKLL